MGILMISAAVTDLRDRALHGLYGDSNAVIYLVFLIAHSKEVSLTPPISPILQCYISSALQSRGASPMGSALPILTWTLPGWPRLAYWHPGI